MRLIICQKVLEHKQVEVYLESFLLFLMQQEQRVIQDKWVRRFLVNIKTSGEAPLHLVSFPDGESVLQKVNLAKKLKLGGVVVFKLDGNGDQAIWDVFRQ